MRGLACASVAVGVDTCTLRRVTEQSTIGAACAHFHINLQAQLNSSSVHWIREAVARIARGRAQGAFNQAEQCAFSRTRA
eukprot:6775096-Pyramimonas_sp.AAC.1